MSALQARPENKRERSVASPDQQVKAPSQQLRQLQRLASVGTMAAMVAHEFNNILTPMLNYAQLADRGGEPTRQRALRHARDGSARAAAICRALLDLAGPEDTAPRRVFLGRLVNETLEAMARDPAKDGIRLILKVPDKLRITTRPVLVKQVLLNLLLNARAAVLKKGRDNSIAVSALRRDKEVFLRVADTGVGIPREIRRRIFEPFFTTDGRGGTGLGLPVCRYIVEMLRGRITVRSQKGKGTCFTVRLPVRGKPAKTGRTARGAAAG